MDKFVELWQMLWEYIYKVIWKLTDGKYGYEDGKYDPEVTFPAP